MSSLQDYWFFMLLPAPIAAVLLGGRGSARKVGAIMALAIAAWFVVAPGTCVIEAVMRPEVPIEERESDEVPVPPGLALLVATPFVLAGLALARFAWRRLTVKP